MKNIKIKKLELVELEVIHSELLNFITYQNTMLPKWKTWNQYYDCLLLLDIATKVYYSFRSKIEKTTGSTNISLSPSEAITLLQCCNRVSASRNGYASHCMQKISVLLHGELINLI